MCLVRCVERLASQWERYPASRSSTMLVQLATQTTSAAARREPRSDTQRRRQRRALRLASPRRSTPFSVAVPFELGQQASSSVVPGELPGHRGEQQRGRAGSCFAPRSDTFLDAILSEEASCATVLEMARAHLTRRCSRRRAVVLPSFHMTRTLPPAAARALARRG